MTYHTVLLAACNADSAYYEVEHGSHIGQLNRFPSEIRLQTTDRPARAQRPVALTLTCKVKTGWANS